jgi:DNA mismatch repair protein MutS
LERSDTTIEGTSVSLEKEPPRTSLPQPHPIIEEVKQIDLFSMTPLDALNRLADLQRRIGPTGQDNRDK